jgi:hypothetical protein
MKTYRYKETLFIALPRDQQTPISWGECNCPYCKAHPDQTPMWDTISAPIDGKCAAFTVHYPDMPGR